MKSSLVIHAVTAEAAQHFSSTHIRQRADELPSKEASKGRVKESELQLEEAKAPTEKWVDLVSRTSTAFVQVENVLSDQPSVNVRVDLNGEEVQVRAATSGQLEDLIRQRLGAKYLPLVLDFAGIDLALEDRDTSLQDLGLVDDALVTATVQDDAETKQIAMEAQEWEKNIVKLEQINPDQWDDDRSFRGYFVHPPAHVGSTFTSVDGYMPAQAFPLIMQADKLERHLGRNGRFKSFRQRLLADWDKKVQAFLKLNSDRLLGLQNDLVRWAPVVIPQGFSGRYFAGVQFSRFELSFLYQRIFDVILTEFCSKTYIQACKRQRHGTNYR